MGLFKSRAVLLCTLITCYATVSRNHGSSPCEAKPNTGPCRGIFTRYYYDPSIQKCATFIWGGCQGDVPFETLEDCVWECETDGFDDIDSYNFESNGEQKQEDLQRCLLPPVPGSCSGEMNVIMLVIKPQLK